MISLSFAVLTLVFVPHTLDIENLKFKLTLLVRDPYIYGHDVACSVRGTRINTVWSYRNFDRRLPSCFSLRKYQTNQINKEAT